MIVDNDIDIKSPKEIHLREQLGDLDEELFNAVEDRETWDNASDFGNGKLREFRKERNENEREIEKNGDLWDDEKTLIKILENKEFNNKIKKLEDERKSLSKQ